MQYDANEQKNFICHTVYAEIRHTCKSYIIIHAAETLLMHLNTDCMQLYVSIVSNIAITSTLNIY